MVSPFVVCSKVRKDCQEQVRVRTDRLRIQPVPDRPDRQWVRPDRSLIKIQTMEICIFFIVKNFLKLTYIFALETSLFTDRSCCGTSPTLNQGSTLFHDDCLLVFSPCGCEDLLCTKSYKFVQVHGKFVQLHGQE
jgi:hypothetical protein